MLFRSDTGCNSWTTGPNTNVAHSFTGGTAIGSTLLVIGGYNGTNDVNTVEKSVVGVPCGTLTSNQTIYIGSNSGTLYGLNASGQQIWSTQVGAEIPAPDEQNAVLTTGLGAGDGLLIVPTPTILVAYGN